PGHVTVTGRPVRARKTGIRQPHERAEDDDEQGKGRGGPGQLAQARCRQVRRGKSSRDHQCTTLTRSWRTRATSKSGPKRSISKPLGLTSASAGVPPASGRYAASTL